MSLRGSGVYWWQLLEKKYKKYQWYSLQSQLPPLSRNLEFKRGDSKKTLGKFSKSEKTRVYLSEYYWYVYIIITLIFLVQLLHTYIGMLTQLMQKSLTSKERSRIWFILQFRRLQLWGPFHKLLMKMCLLISLLTWWNLKHTDIESSSHSMVGIQNLLPCLKTIGISRLLKDLPITLWVPRCFHFNVEPWEMYCKIGM